MMITSIILPILVLALVMLVMRARRRFKPTKSATTDFDFAIEQLLRLRQSGQISDEEFERAKAGVLSRRREGNDDQSQRGFEVLPPRKPLIQSLEDRIAP